uniref:receptor-type tyrosine-protein phosphatase S-like n=1 Tax=Panthera onca TaxID=9690 RepID=UPI002955D236
PRARARTPSHTRARAHTRALPGDCGRPLPRAACAPGGGGAERSVLGQPSRPLPSPHPSISPLVDTRLFWVRLLFGLVLFCLLSSSVLFSLSHLLFPRPPPPAHPASPPRPHVLPPPIEPSAPPQDVKCVSTRSTAILVSWRPPPPETHNGALVSYSVRYRPLGSEDPQPKEVNGIPPTATQILLEALDKWTEYRITTVAHTEVGPGPESSPVVIRTDEDVPSAPPRKVEAEALNATAIRVLWRSPAPGRQHGQIRGYQVHYVRMEGAEARGPPRIKDVMLADAQWETDDTAEYVSSTPARPLQCSPAGRAVT